MTDSGAKTAPTGSPVVRVVGRLNELISSVPVSIPLLVLRLAVAIPFWKSGLTKWDGFLQISKGAVYLFQEEFRIHLFGATFPYSFPTAMAFLSSVGEIVFPLMLFFGLGTRFAALGILAMTAVIQLTIPDGWANFHLPWAAMALALITFGPGRISLDRLIAARFRS